MQNIYNINEELVSKQEYEENSLTIDIYLTNIAINNKQEIFNIDIKENEYSEIKSKVLNSIKNKFNDIISDIQQYESIHKFIQENIENEEYNINIIFDTTDIISFEIDCQYFSIYCIGNHLTNKIIIELIESYTNILEEPIKISFDSIDEIDKGDELISKLGLDDLTNTEREQFMEDFKNSLKEIKRNMKMKEIMNNLSEFKKQKEFLNQMQNMIDNHKEIIIKNFINSSFSNINDYLREKLINKLNVYYYDDYLTSEISPFEEESFDKNIKLTMNIDKLEIKFLEHNYEYSIDNIKKRIDIDIEDINKKKLNEIIKEIKLYYGIE